MRDKWIEELKNSRKILIYGAHLVAVEYYRYVCTLGYGDKVAGFAVSDMKDNPEEIEGKKVRVIKDYIHYAGDCLVVIAMPGKYHESVEAYVKELGFEDVMKISLEQLSEIKADRLINDHEHILPFEIRKSENDPTWLDAYAGVSSDCRVCKYPTLFYLDDEEMISKSEDLQGCFEKELGDIRDIGYFSGKEAGHSLEEWNKKLQIYMIFGEREIPFIRERIFDPWVIPLQVGSQNAEIRHGNCFDDEGEDNLTGKNSVLAEMTGAYWIWKQAPHSDYKGLCHYRRHFVLTEDNISSMCENDMDVLLTTPRFVPGGIRGMFLEETPVKKPVIENILSAMAEVTPDDRDDFEEYLSRNFYFPNNMVVAKDAIYDEYSTWVFPILLRMMEIDMETGYGHESDRHIAYASELLTSYYFIKRRNELKITYTDYKFYG